MAGLLLLFSPQGFQKHLPADEGQEPKGDPMVETGHVFLEPSSQHPAQKGHPSLEHTEKPGDDGGMAVVESFHGKAPADGYGKGVHGQSNGNEKKFIQLHGSTS
jgi:hypothetical protein